MDIAISFLLVFRNSYTDSFDKTATQIENSASYYCTVYIFLVCLFNTFYLKKRKIKLTHRIGTSLYNKIQCFSSTVAVIQTVNTQGRTL